MNRKLVITGIGLILVAALILYRGLRTPSTGSTRTNPAVTSSSRAPDPTPSSPANPDATKAEPDPQRDLPRLTPVRQSKWHGWTDADGRDPNVIKLLALNPQHHNYLLEQNQVIFRRQLVYRFQTLHRVLQQARSSGEPVTELVVPGLDGEEYQVEIRDMHLEPDARRGSITGTLAGSPDSMVVIAFDGDRESIIVVDPGRHLHLVGEPREPGQIILNLVDPHRFGGTDRLWPGDFIRRNP